MNENRKSCSGTENGLSKREKRIRREYLALVKRKAPKSPLLSQCVRAFFVGGAICTLGQLISNAGSGLLRLSGKDVSAFVSTVMIFIGALLTGLGVYDKIGAFAGAGAAVPITGFANAIVSSAMEHRREGLVMGVGAQLFTIAGPVLVYGITASAVIGLISLAL